MQQDYSQPAQPGSSIKSLLALWLILGLPGALLACLGYYIIKLDHFVQWRMFAQAPPDAAQVLNVNRYSEDNIMVQVRTTSGEVLSCWANSELCWIPAAVTSSGDPCNNYPIALANLPQDLLNCAATSGLNAKGNDGRYTLLAALDQQGNIWSWQKTSPYYPELTYLELALQGCGIGILVGNTFWIVRRLRAKRNPGQVAPLSDSQTAAWVLSVLPFVCLGGIILIKLWDALGSSNSYAQHSPGYTPPRGGCPRCLPDGRSGAVPGASDACPNRPRL